MGSFSLWLRLNGYKAPICDLRRHISAVVFKKKPQVSAPICNRNELDIVIKCQTDAIITKLSPNELNSRTVTMVSLIDDHSLNISPVQ